MFNIKLFCSPPGSASNDMNTVLQNWKERMDFTKKLLTLLNSYTPPDIRTSAIGNVRNYVIGNHNTNSHF